MALKFTLAVSEIEFWLQVNYGPEWNVESLFRHLSLASTFLMSESKLQVILLSKIFSSQLTFE